jgi:hypothetical protein
MWKAGTSKVAALAYVGSGPMGWPPRASIECTDRMLVFVGLVSLVVGCQHKLDLSPLLHWL